ncbi:MAG: hypothetical protein M0Z95_03715 [Actinomycetota bacterium]|nr:hypothetical protein [Actinomycetota bacterium]
MGVAEAPGAGERRDGADGLAQAGGSRSDTNRPPSAGTMVGVSNVERAIGITNIRSVT